MTETANLVSANYDMDEYPSPAGGAAIPARESRIVDGELQVRGDMLFDRILEGRGIYKGRLRRRLAETGDLAPSTKRDTSISPAASRT